MWAASTAFVRNSELGRSRITEQNFTVTTSSVFCLFWANANTLLNEIKNNYDEDVMHRSGIDLDNLICLFLVLSWQL